MTLSNKRVIAFQPEWSETDPGIQLSPSSSNVTNPDDLTVTYPFIDGLDVDKKNQPQPVSLQGQVEVIAPKRLHSFDLGKQDVGQTRTDGNLSVTLLKLERTTPKSNSATACRWPRRSPIPHSTRCSSRPATRPGNIWCAPARSTKAPHRWRFIRNN